MEQLLLPKLLSETVTHQLSQTETRNYYKISCWLYIYLMCFLWHNKHLIHTIAKNYNFINIDKKCRNFFAQEIFPKFFEILRFSQLFNKLRLGGALVPLQPWLIHHQLVLLFFFSVIREPASFVLNISLSWLHENHNLLFLCFAA